MSDKLNPVNSKTACQALVKYAPWVLVILGLFLSVYISSALGIIGSVCGCVLVIYLTKSRKRDVFLPKTTLIIGVISILLVIISLAVGHSVSGFYATSTESKNTIVFQNSKKSHDGKLMFILNDIDDKNKISGDLVFQVAVKGTTAEGESVEDYYDATIGTKYKLKNKAGDYELSISQGSLTQGDVVYSASIKKVSFDESEDETVELNVSVDDSATKALAETKKSEEEEAAKKKQEEEKAAEEAKKQQEAQNSASSGAVAGVQGAGAMSGTNSGLSSSGASSSSTADESQTVYITSSGKKYHMDGCRHLSKSKTAITLGEAKAQGYTACGTCNPPN